jgi:ABC-2 type transport system ATP-binding protein
MVSRVAAGLTLAAVLLAATLGAVWLRPGGGGTAPGGDADTPAGSFDRSDRVISSFDGTPIAFTLWRPAAATTQAPVPLVLLADALTARGFGVVAPDLRGHGESGGLSRLSDPAQDVRDLAALLDWAHDNLDWLIRQPETGLPKDLLVGAWGYSLGGAMIHISAATDGRIDALVPQNTMNDYLSIVAPNDALKSIWVNVFIAAGTIGGTGPLGTWRPDPFFHDAYVEGMATNRLPDRAKRFFDSISPFTYLGDVTQPALYIQGMNDMAFPFNEPYKSYASLRANGTLARVFTWLGGHQVPLLQSTPASTPCGDIEPLVADWFEATLRGGVEIPSPDFRIALDDNTCVEVDDVPETRRPYPLPPIVLPAGAGSVLIPVQSFTDARRVVGFPQVVITSATVAGVDDILYFSLVAVDEDGNRRVLNDQVTPMRVPGPSTVRGTLVLNGIAATLKTGDELFLKVDRVNEWFHSNSGRTPGAIAITEATLILPVLA